MLVCSIHIFLYSQTFFFLPRNSVTSQLSQFSSAYSLPPYTCVWAFVVVVSDVIIHIYIHTYIRITYVHAYIYLYILVLFLPFSSPLWSMFTSLFFPLSLILPPSDPSLLFTWHLRHTCTRAHTNHALCSNTSAALEHWCTTATLSWYLLSLSLSLWNLYIHIYIPPYAPIESSVWHVRILSHPCTYTDTARGLN